MLVTRWKYYTTVCRERLETDQNEDSIFDLQCQALLEDGWTLSGGVAAAVVNGRIMLVQAFVARELDI